MARLRKSDRVLNILRQLLDGRPCAVDSLAQRLEVSERSIFRDLSTLEKAGFNINRADAQITLQIKFDSSGTAAFSDQEILLLQIILESTRRENGLPFLHIAESLGNKLINRLPQIKNISARHKHRVNIKSEPMTYLDDHATHFHVFLDCILHEVSMDCVYEPAHSSKQEVSQAFQFDPYELIFASHAWFVIGRRRDRGQYRTLKVNRFSEVRATQHKFKRRKDFLLNDYLKDAWRIIPGKPHMVVELLFAREFADNIEETHWHKTQDTQRLEDGRLKFTCSVDGMDEIKWWVLSMGPKCEVVAPAILRKEVHRLACEAADVNKS